MKRKKILSIAALTLAIGLTATAYASTTEGTNSNSINNTTSTTQGIGLRRITGMRGYDFVSSILKDKLKLNDEDINKARLDGKTLYDIAQEKGLSHDELKNSMLDAKYKAIDDAVLKGTITESEGKSYKEAIKSRSENAISGQGRINKMKGSLGNQGQGQGRGMRGNGYNCTYENSVTK